MEETLKRLLAAESRANEITAEAEKKAAKLVREAMDEAELMENRFREQIPELRAGFIDKGEKNAAQSIKELQRRYDEQLNRLRVDAEEHEEEALDAAFAYLMKTAAE